MLLWQDDQFIWRLRPLHELMARNYDLEIFEHGMEVKTRTWTQAETTKFIHELTPIEEPKFLAAGSMLSTGQTTTLVEPEMIMAMEGLDELEELSIYQTLKTLRWTIPISFSNHQLRFRLALVL